MTEEATAGYRQPEAVGRTIRGIGNASAVLAGICVVALCVLMLAEAFMRYVFASPLGWNVSATEKILLPASMFLALPWLYVCAGHVSAGLLYDRMPAPVQLCARWASFSVVVVVSAVLLWGGTLTVVDSFSLGLAPPPGTSDVPVPTWTWQLIQPVGALGVLVVALLDAPRFLRLDGALVETEGEVEA
jgi:TRAP-type C4-dicarboxylate transport system permease small subunit